MVRVPGLNGGRGSSGVIEIPIRTGVNIFKSLVTFDRDTKLALIYRHTDKTNRLYTLYSSVQ